jgi:hypothetical protein
MREVVMPGFYQTHLAKTINLHSRGGHSKNPSNLANVDISGKIVGIVLVPKCS